MNTVILQQPKRLIFGDASIREAAAEFQRHGWKRLFVITSSAVGALQTPVFQSWRDAGMALEVCSAVDREPEISLFEQVIGLARAFRPDVIIGFGGGSPLDVSKLVAALYDDHQQIRSVFGIGLLAKRALPLVC